MNHVASLPAIGRSAWAPGLLSPRGSLRLVGGDLVGISPLGACAPAHPAPRAKPTGATEPDARPQQSSAKAPLGGQLSLTLDRS
jgi:hypothetical protein